MKLGYYCGSRCRCHGEEIPLESVTPFGLKLLSFFWISASRLEHGGTTISLYLRPAWWRMRLMNLRRS